MKTSISFALIISAMLVQAAPIKSLFDNVYELTSSDGRKLRAKILEFKPQVISVEAEANKTVYEIPYAKLNQLTQTQLHELWAMEINQKLGLEIMPKNNEKLWKYNILDFAEKFSINRQIKIPDTADYYYLTNYEGQILGARAYHLRAYPNDLGDKTKLKHVEIEFANVKAYPGSEEEIDATSFFVTKKGGFDDLEAAMLADKKVVSKQLNQSFGQGVEAINGDRTFTRWDSKGYSFLLESRSSEALILHIVPTASLPSLDKNNE